MEVQVVVKQILPDFSYQSKKDGSMQVRHSFVGETMGQYPRTIKFDVMNEDKWAKMNLRVGVTYTVGFEIDSREWNGKWFTSLNAWKAFEVGGASSSPSSSSSQPQGGHSYGQSPAPQPQPQQNNSDDVPF